MRNEQEDMEEGLEVTEDSIGDIVLESVEHVRDNAATAVKTLGQAEISTKQTIQVLSPFGLFLKIVYRPKVRTWNRLGVRSKSRNQS